MSESKSRLYEIVSVTNSLYINSGTAVNGYRITAVIIPFNETQFFDVPDIKTGTVNDAIMDYIDARIKLSELGTVEDSNQ